MPERQRYKRVLARRGRWVGRRHRYRYPVDTGTLTRTSGALDSESPLAEEAAVWPWNQVVRADGWHRAVGVHAFAQIRIIATRLPAAVVPSVLENRWRCRIAGQIIGVVHAHHTTVHVAAGGVLDGKSLGLHRCRHTVEGLP